MKVMIRAQALDRAALAAAEQHGKRLDYTSQKRRVRNMKPLVAGGLDLLDLHDAHMTIPADGEGSKAKDVKVNAGAKKVAMHFILKFPAETISDREFGHFKGGKKERQHMMLRQAVSFINRTHGGDAVFAARVDRDEAGEIIVDVFAAPKYEKRTKRTPVDETGPIWMSLTKFGKELTDKHRAEIQGRHPTAKGALRGPRAVGIALNSEFRDWFQRVNDVRLDAKEEKVSTAPDRLDTEAYKELQEQRVALSAVYERFKGVVRHVADVLGVRRSMDDIETELMKQKPENPFQDAERDDPSLSM